MKKKVGIVTHYYNSYNYGGLLQSYALVKELEKLNYEAYQIACKTPFEDSLFKNIIRHFYVFFKIRLTKDRRNRLLRKKTKKRKEACSLFMKKINHSKPYRKGTIKNCLKDFSIFITGSDQVWNPDWVKSAYYLSFVPDKFLKIAYAASIGKIDLTQKELTYAVPKINRLDYISVREQEAKDILKPFINKEIKVVLDPTFLLTQKDWDLVSTPVLIDNSYIFVYLLGNNKVHRKTIKKYAKKLDLKIVFLPHIHFQYEPADENFADIDLYDIGPAEFVGLIEKAKMVITDSFHGCVFSIIYHKKFWALKRHKDSEKENMNSRLYTLFSNLGLDERLLEDDAELSKEELLAEIDYNVVNEKLEVLRKDSVDFLENALSESVKIIEKNQENKGTKKFEN